MALPKLDTNTNPTEEVKKPTLPKIGGLGGLPPVGLPKPPVAPQPQEELYEEDISELEDITDELSETQYLEEEDEEELPAEDLTEVFTDPMEFDEVQDDDKYIDKVNRKIKPMGKKGKSKIKSSDFDGRKNIATSGKIVTIGVTVGFVLLFGLGVKNTFFPSNNFTQPEIISIAQRAAGKTGFPLDRGAAFVEDFMTEYLEYSVDDLARNKTLSYFYGVTDGVSRVKTTYASDTKQRIVISPTVYSKESSSDYSAQYKVTTYVTDVDGNQAYEANPTGRWITFAVNTYYDKETDRLAITPESPTLIPKYEIMPITNVPTMQALGNGNINQDIITNLTPTIDGYVKAYAQVSFNSHNEIKQYIPSDPSVDLYSGFGGSVRVAPGSNSIQKVVYNTDNPDEFKVAVTVKWEDNTTTDDKKKVTHDSQYVMTIVKTTDNKYLVTGFKPYVFIKTQQ